MFQLEDSFDDDLDLDLALSASKVESCHEKPLSSKDTENNKPVLLNSFKVPQVTPKRKSLSHTENIKQKLNINSKNENCNVSVSDIKSMIPTVGTYTNGSFFKQSDIETVNRNPSTFNDTPSCMHTPVMTRSVRRIPDSNTPSDSDWTTPGSARQVETPTNSSSTSSSGRKKRKFPGPAGLLPILVC